MITGWARKFVSKLSVVRKDRGFDRSRIPCPTVAKTVAFGILILKDGLTPLPPEAVPAFHQEPTRQDGTQSEAAGADVRSDFPAALMETGRGPWLFSALAD